MVHKSHDKQLKMIVSLSRPPKQDYGQLKKGAATYAERFARIQEFKAQDTYHPLDRSGVQPFHHTRQVGEGLHAHRTAFDHQSIDGETQEHMSQLAETMLDEEQNILLMPPFQNPAEVLGKRPGRGTGGKRSQKHSRGQKDQLNHSAELGESPGQDIIQGFLAEMSSSQATSRPLERVI